MSKATLPQKPHNGRLFDLRRKAQITLGGAQDHKNEVVEGEMPHFDIQKTIFKTLDPALHPMIKKRYGKLLFWSDTAIERIEREAGELLTDNDSRWMDLTSKRPELLSFMRNECEFDCEHADGSFLDHLEFCFEYCFTHFPQGSPIVLFLHSIMGVGTNLFPMLLEQRERLATFVSGNDLLHIECFPSVLRLLQTDLLPYLEQLSTSQLLTIDSLECHRLLGPNMRELMQSDNAVLHLTGENFWIHMHYHLIHCLDFLPARDWETRCADGMFPLLIGLHRVLRRAGKLYAAVNFDSDKWARMLNTMDQKERRSDEIKIIKSCMVQRSSVLRGVIAASPSTNGFMLRFMGEIK